MLRIATRKSPLALWQANYIKQQLENIWPSISIKLIALSTSGDKFINKDLSKIGGKGLFLKELEEALLAGRADIAVHSLKDVPAVLPPQLEIAVICKRADPFDALVSKNNIKFADLPTNAVIGTSSLRRKTQLLAIRSDLKFIAIRGNIHTRLKKLTNDNNDLDAIVLAAAGLKRMGLEENITEIIDYITPACGQGALGIECHSENQAIKKLIEPLNDLQTSLCVTTERLINEQLGGSCHSPVAIYCYKKNDVLHLDARVLSSCGQVSCHVTQSSKSKDYVSLAKFCTDELLAQGAAKFL